MTDIPEEIYTGLSQALYEGDENEAEAFTRQALKQGIDPLAVIKEVIVPTLSEVGMNFQEFRIFLPELMLSGEAAKRAGGLLEEAILAAGRPASAIGKVVIGTVEGDIHDIGLNIVASMLNANVFDVINLGRNVKPSVFMETAEKEKADVVMMSALMTTTLPVQRRTINLFAEQGLREKYKLLVGGGAVTQEWADSIGADGYSADAGATVELCKLLVGVS